MVKIDGYKKLRNSSHGNLGCICIGKWYTKIHRNQSFPAGFGFALSNGPADIRTWITLTKLSENWNCGSELLSFYCLQVFQCLWFQFTFSSRTERISQIILNSLNPWMAKNQRTLQRVSYDAYCNRPDQLLISIVFVHWVFKISLRGIIQEI